MNARATTILAIGIAISLVVAVVCGGAYLVLWKGPGDALHAGKDAGVAAADAGYALLKRAAGDVFRALQVEPRVTIGSRTVHGPPAVITELTTASRTFEHSYQYEVTWLGSTKRLELRGEFLAKAGFVVDETFCLELAEDGSRITIRHQPPALLSCEMTRLRVLKDEDGLWNKLQPSELEAAQNALLQQARRIALDDALREAATRELLERLAPLQPRHQFEARTREVP